MKIKKIMILLLVSIFILSSTLMYVNAADKLSADVKKGTVVIDGVADDIWNYVDEIEIGRIKNSGDSPNDGTGATGTFKLLWDDSNLYIIIFVNDSTRYNIGSASHEQDSIEIFLDPLNTITETYDDDDFRFCIAADGAVSTNGQEHNVEYKAVNSDNSYIIEMAIAIKGAVSSFKFEAGTTFGWDVQLNDSDTGQTARNHCLGWNDDANEAWQNATYLGTLKLVADEAAPPPVIEEVVEAEPADTTAAAPVTVTPVVTTSPQTNDTLIISIGLMLIAVTALMLIKKVKRI